MMTRLTLWPETDLAEADVVYPFRLREVGLLEIGDRVCFLQARYKAAGLAAHDLIEGEVVEIGRYIKLRLTAKNQFPIAMFEGTEELSVMPDTVTKIWAKRLGRTAETGTASFLPKTLPWDIRWKRLDPREISDTEFSLLMERWERARM